MAKRRGVPARSGRSYAELETWAATARAEGLPGQGPLGPRDRIDGLRLFEGLPDQMLNVSGVLYGIAAEVVADADLPPGVPGLAVYEGGRFAVRITEETYRGLESRQDGRALYTLLHEFSHLVFHADDLMHRAAMPHIAPSALQRGTAAHPVYLDTEWQADSAAAAVLMPLEALKDLDAAGQLSEGTLQAMFGVSGAAARFRIDNFRRGVLTRR